MADGIIAVPANTLAAFRKLRRETVMESIR
jgi:hypothetical protein